MSKCPSCNSSYRKRLSRSFLLRMIPKAKLYKCYHCKSKFLNIPYLFSIITLKKGSNESYRVVN